MRSSSLIDQSINSKVIWGAQSDESSYDLDSSIMLQAWNQTQADYPENICVHQLFEAQVEKTPDAVAVIFEQEQLTYRQLNQRANQLAHHLKTLGVRPDVLVGVYLERSLEMVVALLGILKAGGAYVPLDPAAPPDRHAFILEDTQVLITLTQAQLAERLPQQTPVLCLDTHWEQIAQQSQENPSCEATANHLIYVIYTSGSTGQPKGVMITHAGICNQLHWRQATFPLTATDQVLQTISVSFDPSVWQICWPLTVGAQLVLPCPGGHRDSAYLVKVIAQQQITVIALVPSMLRVLMEEPGVEHCRCLRYVFCGGEALSADLQARFFERLNLEQVLHNVYGPTEASIDATFWVCQRQTNFPVAPIGRPIANTQVYILDANLQPVAIGEPGELHIGGVGLARGYLNRPALTAEKFITHPYSSQPNARLYKTGDLARYLPDGNIEFLGRIDHQVKLRGFRIELEEIEVTLNQFPGVQQSVVLAREDVPGDKRLVAYVVASGAQLPVNELRRALKQKLPDYMVPAAFVMLDELPLNPNGKINRSALPAPQPDRPELAAFVAPQDPIEQELAQIWQQVLNLQSIGVTDHFFDLGGSSLLAAQLLSQIEAKFNQRLALATLLQAPTIQQLAEVLRHATGSTFEQSLVAIQPYGSKPPLFCIHARDGNVLIYAQLARYLEQDQPVYGLQARGIDGNQVPHTQIEAIAADYIKEIQALQPVGPYFLTGYSFGGLVAFEMARQLHGQGQTVARLALLDTYRAPSGWFKPLSLRARLAKHIRIWWQLKPAAKLTYFKQGLTGKGTVTDKAGIPLPDVGLQAAHKFHTAFEAAAKAYKPLKYPGKAILFRATQPPEQHWLQPAISDPYLGWREVIVEGIELYEIACDHFSLMFDPHLEVLAKQLQGCLNSVETDR